jgi:hypothetical protein
MVVSVMCIKLRARSAREIDWPLGGLDLRRAGNPEKTEIDARSTRA